jgi:inner membrane protein
MFDMPLPVGHSLMGYALYETSAGEQTQFSWRMVMFFIVIANVPDLDFIPGFVAGEPNKYHHHFWSHSLGAAVVFGLLGALLARGYLKRSFWAAFLLVATIYFSHVFLDLLSKDTSFPYGVPIFWPFTDVYFTSPLPIFMSVHKGGDSSSFLSSLLVAHNLWVAVWEIVVFIPILSIIKLFKVRKNLLPVLRGRSYE